MPQFSYKARRRSGEVVEGVLEVADRPAALLQIERLGLFPVSIAQTKGGVKVESPRENKSASAALPLPPILREMLQRKRKPSMQELATFTQQLANLLRSGMPLTVALNSMTHLESRGIPSEVSRSLKQDVMEGKSLSDAMAKQPVIFTDLYVNMVRAGEQSGALEPVLRRLSDHLQQFAEVQAKFKAAMIYPIAVICVGIVIVSFFVFFMLPKFMDVFNGFHIVLPLPTRMLMGLSDVATKWWWAVLLVVLAVVTIFTRFAATENGKRKLDIWRMNAPVLGKVVKLNLFGQFSRVLATLLRNGVPVLNALKITEQVMPNRILKEAIANAREAVTDGKSLAQPLAQSRIFPQLMVDLLRVGEETGDVPGALENLAETYESELQIALRVMMNLIEPVLIIVMAIGVGALLLSILLPMFQLISSIGTNTGGGK